MCTSPLRDGKCVKMHIPPPTDPSFVCHTPIQYWCWQSRVKANAHVSSHRDGKSVKMHRPPPPTPPLYAIHHTILVLAISSKGQCTRLLYRDGKSVKMHRPPPTDPSFVCHTAYNIGAGNLDVHVSSQRWEEREDAYTPPPPTSPLYAIHHTILVLAISCKGQCTMPCTIQYWWCKYSLKDKTNEHVSSHRDSKSKKMLTLCSACGSTHTESGKLYRKVKHRSPQKSFLTPTAKARPVRRRSRRSQGRGAPHTEHGLEVQLLLALFLGARRLIILIALCTKGGGEGEYPPLQDILALWVHPI